AHDWLIHMAGERVYQAVWRPLLRTKFGRYADQVAAVWIWNKLKLRGSSRGKKQEERLGYVRGGFGQVVDAWEETLRKQGVEILFETPVEHIRTSAGTFQVTAAGETRRFDAVVVTTAPAILARLAPDLPADYGARLERIVYLGNVCLVLQLDRKLSDTYWLNIGDPDIPFTGVIEHTNMQRPEIYGGAHLAYISRYMDIQDPAYNYSAEQLLETYLPYLRRIFAGFERHWVQNVWIWRAPYAQPVIGTQNSTLRPPFRTPNP
ncbi:MAG: FAD-dependent oxidoreductase, partial [Chloroflexi bacterium]|nr:FAD-dependent oxidoreductase [Chloroflexota bacterium]